MAAGPAVRRLPAPAPAPKKKRKWPWVIAGLFFLLVVVPSIANSGKSTPQSGSTAPSNAYTPPPVAKAVPAVVPGTAAPAAAPLSDDGTSTSGPRTSFGDGTWTVGEDIAPGRYKSPGARTGIFEYCQITTHSDLDAQSNLMDWQNGNANDPIKVNISGKVKSVKVSGCEDFVKVG